MEFLLQATVDDSGEEKLQSYLRRATKIPSTGFERGERKKRNDLMLHLIICSSLSNKRSEKDKNASCL